MVNVVTSETLMSSFNIAVDSGKFNTKATFEVLGIEHTAIIRTSKKAGHHSLENVEGIHEIEFNGDKWTIGEEEIQSNNLKQEKSTDAHKIATLTIICKALKAAGVRSKVNVNLAINIPLSEFVLEEEKDAIRKLYIQDEVNGTDYFMIFDGEEFNFTIKNVLVAYETAGIVAKYRPTFIDKNVVIVDCGGLNVTYLAVENGKVRFDNTDSNLCGSNKLVRDIIKGVEKQHRRTLSENTVMKALKNEKAVTGAKAEEINAIIKSTFDSYVQKIVDYLTELVDIDEYEVLMVGGSSPLYREAVSKALGGKTIKLSTNQIFDNVQGVFKGLKAKFPA